MALSNRWYALRGVPDREALMKDLRRNWPSRVQVDRAANTACLNILMPQPGLVHGVRHPIGIERR